MRTVTNAKEKEAPQEASRWSRPYYGITHLLPGAPVRQLTVCDCESFAEAFMLLPGEGFSPKTRHFFHGPDRVEQAKRWLEDKAGAILGRPVGPAPDAEQRP